ncbi:MAG: hypothetical protein INQ03_16970 [Candidatus Heimdallarchaeota archaeon]|nr:hypothetical protein [Candidatus Heimdallarchaeota archaeon]
MINKIAEWNKYETKHVNTSAKTGENIDNLFDFLLNDMKNMASGKKLK